MAIDQATLFNNVPDEKIYMNEYDLGFDNTFTTEVGRLAPIFCRRVLPGERWQVYFEAFARTLALQAPVFGKFDMYVHFFYCPNRILSNIWENYIRAGEDGETEFLPDLLYVNNQNNDQDNRTPITGEELYTIIENSFADSWNYDAEVYRPMFFHGSLSDYLGIGSFTSIEAPGFPNKYFKPFKYSLLPFKAYQAIWSEYYADANVQEFDDMDTIDWRFLQSIHNIQVSPVKDPAVNYVGLDGEPSYGNYSSSVIMRNLFRMRNRCFSKDYFTSALPEPQRGPDVLIPIDADIQILNKTNSTNLTQIQGVDGNGGLNGFLGYDDNLSPHNLRMGTISQQDPTQDDHAFVPNTLGVQVFNAQNLRAEISSLSATITDLRTAVALQEFYESSARYGNRYKEFVYGHFGSMIPDEQLTRPFYLGGAKFPLMIGDVMQTAPGSDGSNVGDMYGKGISSSDGSDEIFNRQFSDYGLVMGIFSIRPHNYYQNNIKKEWTIDDRMEEYWRKLQGVGEEPVFNWELQGFASLNPTSIEHLDDTFGYQMRYSYYKFSNDEIHGDFKGSLSYWTIARDFISDVSLSEEFLVVNPREFNHIFQYTGVDTDHFLIQSHIGVIREAPMDIYSIPRIN